MALLAAASLKQAVQEAIAQNPLMIRGFTCRGLIEAFPGDNGASVDNLSIRGFTCRGLIEAP